MKTYLLLLALVIGGCALPKQKEKHIYLISGGKIVAHYLVKGSVDSRWDYIDFTTDDDQNITWKGDYLESSKPLPQAEANN